MADMANSDENNTQEENNLIDVDPDDMTGDQRKIWDRRMTVDRLLPYLTEGEIATKIGTSKRTVERDVDWLKKEIYRRRVDDLAEDGFSYDILKTKKRLEDKLRKMYRIEHTVGDTPNITDTELLIPLWKIQNDTESLLNNIVGEGPTLQGMKKAVEKTSD